MVESNANAHDESTPAEPFYHLPRESLEGRYSYHSISVVGNGNNLILSGTVSLCEFDIDASLSQHLSVVRHN